MNKAIAKLIEAAELLLDNAKLLKACKKAENVFQRRELLIDAAETFKIAEGLCEVFKLEFDDVGLHTEQQLNEIFGCEVALVSKRQLFGKAVLLEL